MSGLVQAALNGPRVAMSPAELAAEARACGTQHVHAHAYDDAGRETLEAGPVGAVVRALAGFELSLTTGLWITGGDVRERRALVAAWTDLPALCSVNVAEPGFEALCELLLDRGVGIEVGIEDVEGATHYGAGAMPGRAHRVLVEVADVATAAAVDELLDAQGDPTPRLHHGDGPGTWAVLERARRLGHATRVGLEDVEVLPDGTPAGNAALVAALRAL